MLKKGDSKLINAWAFYDWANSVYSLVISTAVFPIYYSSLTETFVDNEGKFALWAIKIHLLQSHPAVGCKHAQTDGAEQRTCRPRNTGELHKYILIFSNILRYSTTCSRVTFIFTYTY